MKCRFCGMNLTREFIDLGESPPSNSFLSEEDLKSPETFYPLKLYICDDCHLVQIDVWRDPKDIFNADYPYYSSYSKSWCEHARVYASMITQRLRLSGSSLVMEIASNDGYMLRFFKEAGVPCMGVEPACNTSVQTKKMGIPVVDGFFDEHLAAQLAEEAVRADLVIGNNVLAHVPDLNSFVKGLKTVLKPGGTITMEFPHLMRMVERNEFDTIYHEHFSYFSLHTARRILAHHGLNLYDVEEFDTQGGSLRIFAEHTESSKHPLSKRVRLLLEEEKRRGMFDEEYSRRFREKVNSVKEELTAFLTRMKKQNKKVVAYGAAAKGNTLLNVCGVTHEEILFVADISPKKQGKYLPGTRIPVRDPEAIRSEQPDVVLILAWNLKREISEQLSFISEWGGQFAVPIPEFCLFKPKKAMEAHAT